LKQLMVRDEMPDLDNRVVEVHLPSELGYEKVAMSSAVTIAESMGFSPDRVDDLRTAVAEACVNAIEHGNKRDVNIKVVVTLTVQDDELKVEIKDSGQQPIPVPDVERGEREDNRGWGMFLIKRLVDEVETSAEPGRNEIRMVIHLERK
jgi:serine/threonine-protein kinase RsbW